jgi:hypothetical protein
MAAAKNAASAPRPATSPTPERRRFTLSGPSRPLDHRTEAARRDLADIALAGRWFAPHYVVPEVWRTTRTVELRSTPSDTAESSARLSTGERFAVLEVSGGWAWGLREADHLVGYVRAEALSCYEGGR